MKGILLPILLLLCYIHTFGLAERFKICITSGFEKECEQLDKESPEVECLRVQDSVECAKILRGGTVGFGIFSAESMVLLAALNYSELNVLKELRHLDRLNHSVDFASVVIVKSNYEGGIQGLKGLKYCHPGFYYGRTERWSERFLKHFERSILENELDAQCNSPLGETGSPAEIEIAAIGNYFGPSCRAGAWSNNEQEDKRLKDKYPQLCELCTSKTSRCEYADANRHVGALNCLINKGQVAYVSLQDAQDFFSVNSQNANLRNEYAYLCDDGTKQSFNDESKKPCTWMTQPWPSIVSSAYQNIVLSGRINSWAGSLYGWENAVRQILTANSLVPTLITTVQKLRDAFTPHHGVPYEIPLCSKTVTWCTKSLEEKDKCEVIRTAGFTTGVYPTILCQEPVMGTLGCLREVREGRADFAVIDSNYGYIARSQFNLTAALFGETDTHSLAGVVVRKSTYENLTSIAGVTACVNEYNGIASVAFINNGKKIGLFDKKNCNQSQLLGDFFGSSCVPGASDPAHSVHQTPDNLCTLCPQSHYTDVPTVDIGTREAIPADAAPLAPESSLQNELDVLNSHQNCNADQSNRYYGDKGALLCLMNKGGVAILGLKNLNEHAKDLTIDPHYYQVICRNGSLASNTGFEVDADCALATYVDSEVVIRSNSTKRDGIINALLSFDKYFRVDPDFKLYGKFDGHENVLFNKGTVGLASYDDTELGPDVDNYKKLLKEVDDCGNAGFTSTPFASILVGIMLCSLILNRLQQ